MGQTTVKEKQLDDLSYAAIASTSRTGADAKIVTGTAGTSAKNQLGYWNSDGDLVASSSFALDRGSTSCTTGSATTIGSLEAPGVYIVSIWIAANESGNPYFETALISVDGTTRFHINILQDGSVVTISMSNLDLQATQSSGVTLTVQWSVLRIG